MSIKLKAFVLVNKELMKIKLEKANKEDQERHIRWCKNNLVHNDTLKTHMDDIRDDQYKKDMFAQRVTG